MALFTDAGALTIDDLLTYEGTLVQVASGHDINVDTKISLALGAVGDQLMSWLLNVGASDPQQLTRRQLGLSTVVITESLRRWLVYESLARVFAEAYNLQLNTRFQSKWREYRSEARHASEAAFQAGIGIVFNALPKPTLPLVSIQAGDSVATALFVQTTWVDSKGAESAASPVNGLILTAGQSISIAMAEGVVDAPYASVGWNAYVGVDQSPPTRQTANPQPVGGTWELPAAGIAAGNIAGQGQMPNFYIRVSKQILRG